MKNVLIFLGSIILFSIVVLGIYALLKKILFDKIKINKWIVLIMAVIVFIVPPLVFPTLPLIVTNYIIPGVFVILFLWFWDLCGFMSRAKNKVAKASYNTPKSKKNDIVIRPKAKPNRIKNNSRNK